MIDEQLSSVLCGCTDALKSPGIKGNKVVRPVERDEVVTLVTDIILLVTVLLVTVVFHPTVWIVHPDDVGCLSVSCQESSMCSGIEVGMCCLSCKEYTGLQQKTLTSVNSFIQKHN